MSFKIVTAIIESDVLEYVLACHIHRTIILHRGIVVSAAEQLGIDVATVYKKIKEYGMVIDKETRTISWPYGRRLELAR